MERYCAITSVTFGQSAISLPISVRVARRAEPLPLAGEADAFDTSVQLRQPGIAVEVRTRDVAAAETFSLGQIGVLTAEVAGTRSGQKSRKISLEGAVLTGVEVQYEQAAPAVATLRFLAEAPDGSTDPFSSQELQP